MKQLAKVDIRVFLLGDERNFPVLHVSPLELRQPRQEYASTVWTFSYRKRKETKDKNSRNL